MHTFARQQPSPYLLLGCPIFLLRLFCCWVLTPKPRWFELLARAIEKSGPSLLKFFQWASTRRDLFPEGFCRQAARLLDHTEGDVGGWEHSREALSHAFGPPSSDGSWLVRSPELGELVLNFEGENGSPPPALGAGCVAQVFKGVGRQMRSADMVCRQISSGIISSADESRFETFEEPPSELFVAAKVIHPNVVEAVQLDMAIMTFGAWALESMPFGLKWLGLTDAVDQFRHIMETQLDLRVEARSLAKVTPLKTPSSPPSVLRLQIAQ